MSNNMVSTHLLVHCGDVHCDCCGLVPMTSTGVWVCYIPLTVCDLWTVISWSLTVTNTVLA